MAQQQSPFERLAGLLADVTPARDPIDMTVGGPRHTMPAGVMAAIDSAADSFRDYPAIAGVPAWREAVHGWLDRRYGLAGWFRETGTVLPLNGSREGLFFAAISARDWWGKERPAVLFANPFYQTYPAAAAAIGAEAVPVPPGRAGPLPDWETIPGEILDRTIAVYLAAPSNPAGTVATRADWARALEVARRHRFFVFADECYSEIYREAAGPPAGALEAARDLGEGALNHLVAFNSLSKRSNVAGLRCGIAAGGRAFLEAMRAFRNQAAPQVPTPIQVAAAALYGDEGHVAENRRLYDEKFEIARELLGPTFGDVVPPAGFFLWLDVSRWGPDPDVARRLFAETGVKCVPGSYLALTGPDHNNPGSGHLRLALVSETAAARDALARIADVIAAWA